MNRKQKNQSKTKRKRNETKRKERENDNNKSMMEFFNAIRQLFLQNIQNIQNKINFHVKEFEVCYFNHWWRRVSQE